MDSKRVKALRVNIPGPEGAQDGLFPAFRGPRTRGAVPWGPPGPGGVHEGLPAQGYLTAFVMLWYNSLVQLQIH